MKYIKWVSFLLVLLAMAQSHSRPTGFPDGWNCFHEGEFYAIVSDYQTCPSPHQDTTQYDPNDHNCVIFKYRRYVQQ